MVWRSRILLVLGGSFLTAVCLSVDRAGAQPGLEFGRQFAQAAEEDEASEEAEEEEPVERDCLLGPFLHGHEESIQAEYIYTGEVFTNMRGGIRTHNATRYKGNLDLFLTGNLEQMGLFPGGNVFLYATDGHGQGITEQFVGDYLEVSDIDFLNCMQMTEYWWERHFCDRFVHLRIGKQDANADFAVVEIAEPFINGAYEQHPNIPMPSWPHSAMGAELFLHLSDDLTFRSGVWDGAADGRTWGFSGTGEVFTMYELEGKYAIDDKPGEWNVGLWYHSGWFGDLDGSPELRGNHGFYITVNQTIYQEQPWDEEDEQGLGVFVQYCTSPGDRSEAPNYVGGGMVYRGLLDGRDEDTIGLGAAHVVFSNLLVDQTAETDIELFYKAQVLPYLAIQPDLQYVVKPSGMYRDAFVFGIRFELNL